MCTVGIGDDGQVVDTELPVEGDDSDVLHESREEGLLRIPAARPSGQFTGRDPGVDRPAPVVGEVESVAVGPGSSTVSTRLKLSTRVFTVFKPR